MICAICSSSVSDTAKVCGYCGTRLRSPSGDLNPGTAILDTSPGPLDPPVSDPAATALTPPAPDDAHPAVNAPPDTGTTPTATPFAIETDEPDNALTVGETSTESEVIASEAESVPPIGEEALAVDDTPATEDPGVPPPPDLEPAAVPPEEDPSPLEEPPLRDAGHEPPAPPAEQPATDDPATKEPQVESGRDTPEEPSLAAVISVPGTTATAPEATSQSTSLADPSPLVSEPARSGSPTERKRTTRRILVGFVVLVVVGALVAVGYFMTQPSPRTAFAQQYLDGAEVIDDDGITSIQVYDYETDSDRFGWWFDNRPVPPSTNDSMTLTYDAAPNAWREPGHDAPFAVLFEFSFDSARSGFGVTIERSLDNGQYWSFDLVHEGDSDAEIVAYIDKRLIRSDLQLVIRPNTLYWALLAVTPDTRLFYAIGNADTEETVARGFVDAGTDLMGTWKGAIGVWDEESRLTVHHVAAYTFDQVHK